MAVKRLTKKMLGRKMTRKVQRGGGAFRRAIPGSPAARATYIRNSSGKYRMATPTS